MRSSEEIWTRFTSYLKVSLFVAIQKILFMSEKIMPSLSGKRKQISYKKRHTTKSFHISFRLHKYRRRQIYVVFKISILLPLKLPADLCLTGLQISTNQRATRKCIWRSFHSRAFREGKFIVLRNSGILFLTVQHLSTFAYDTHGQVKDMRLLKLNVLFMLR